MSVHDNVGYGLRLRGLPRRRGVGAACRPLLATVGMAGLERAPPRPALGRPAAAGLAGPRSSCWSRTCCCWTSRSSNLDARLRVEMRREIRRLQREVGITTIFVTHDQEEALQLSDVIAVMSRGRVVQVGTRGGGVRAPALAVRGDVPRRGHGAAGRGAGRRLAARGGDRSCPSACPPRTRGARCASPCGRRAWPCAAPGAAGAWTPP